MGTQHPRCFDNNTCPSNVGRDVLQSWCYTMGWYRKRSHQRHNSCKYAIMISIMMCPCLNYFVLFLCVWFLLNGVLYQPSSVSPVNIDFTNKYSYTTGASVPEYEIRNILSFNGYSIRHESDGWGFEFLSGRDIFCLKASTHSHEHPFISRKWMVLPMHNWHLKFWFCKHEN